MYRYALVLHTQTRFCMCVFLCVGLVTCVVIAAAVVVVCCTESYALRIEYANELS